VRGDVTGVADCTAIGAGAGVQCILTATWPTIDLFIPPPRYVGPPPLTEGLRTLKPAVLVLGLNLDPPGIRAQMVDAESLSHTWVGPLAEGSAWASRVNRSLRGRHIHLLQVIAEPGSEIVTLVLRSYSVVITLTMHRDPGAREDQPIKTLRSR
jgi:hypothetical protein